jgi:cell fate regulator YaaT (PSP1 superfamily)
MTVPSKFAIKIRKQHQPITFDVKKAPFFIKVGDIIVVETSRGEEAGVVVKLPLPCVKHGLHENIAIRQVLRMATPEDRERMTELAGLEQEYLQKANVLFDSKTDAVKIIACEVLFSKKKIIVYYRPLEKEEGKKDAKKKIDKPPLTHFNVKEMNKELFHLLNIPVELKEMGNRASAYVVGGTGHCGCNLCCTTWLHKPKQVSVKMAKEQSLAINIPKLSGVCGKLMCCISYEVDQYERGQLQDAHKKAKHDEFSTMFEAKTAE